MNALRTFAVVGAWFISAVCMAGAPAGPEAADAILRQNPQIKTLKDLPDNLKGVSVQDCPANTTPDISRNRCLVATAPASSSAQPWESNYGTVQAYVLILHVNSPKVWGVFKADPNDPSKNALLGEFDVNGKLTSKRTPAAAATQTTSQPSTGRAVSKYDASPEYVERRARANHCDPRFYGGLHNLPADCPNRLQTGN